jgi:hypothetical protein
MPISWRGTARAHSVLAKCTCPAGQGPCRPIWRALNQMRRLKRLVNRGKAKQVF